METASFLCQFRKTAIISQISVVSQFGLRTSTPIEMQRFCWALRIMLFMFSLVYLLCRKLQHMLRDTAFKKNKVWTMCGSLIVDYRQHSLKSEKHLMYSKITEDVLTHILCHVGVLSQKNSKGRKNNQNSVSERWNPFSSLHPARQNPKSLFQTGQISSLFFPSL